MNEQAAKLEVRKYFLLMWRLDLDTIRYWALVAVGGRGSRESESEPHQETDPSIHLHGIALSSTKAQQSLDEATDGFADLRTDTERRYPGTRSCSKVPCTIAVVLAMRLVLLKYMQVGDLPFDTSLPNCTNLVWIVMRTPSVPVSCPGTRHTTLYS